MPAPTPLPDPDVMRLRGLLARLDAPGPAAPGPRACSVPDCVHSHDAAERERPLAA